MNRLAIIVRNMPKPSVYTISNLIGMSLVKVPSNADRDTLTKEDIIDAYNEIAYGIYMLENGKYDFQSRHYRFRESLKIKWNDVFFDGEIDTWLKNIIDVAYVVIEFYIVGEGEEWGFALHEPIVSDAKQKE